jgi:hypothetical protein
VLTVGSLYDFAAANVNACHLLRLADEDRLSGVALRRELNRWCPVGLSTSRGLLYLLLIDSVRRYTQWEHDGRVEGWSFEQIRGDVLRWLFPLATGQTACEECLAGWCDDLDMVHASEVCSRHSKRVAA